MNRVQQAELLRRRVAFMNTRSAPMMASQAAICGTPNTTANVGLMPQLQGNTMSQAGKHNVSPMQGNQMGNKMLNSKTMASLNSMNANTGMIGSNSMMGNPNQIQQQQQMNSGNMMSPGMNVNNQMGGNNPMNSGNMMNANNQMVGSMNNMNQMTNNAGNQMPQQSQQVIYLSFGLFFFFLKLKLRSFVECMKIIEFDLFR